MAEQNETIQEIQSRNKHQALQKKRIEVITNLAGLLGIAELKYIQTELHNMIEDIERKNK